MLLSNAYQRGRVAALALLVSLTCACHTPSGGSGHAPVANLNLTAAEEQRANALAHYGTAIALWQSQGVEAALPEYRMAFNLDPGNATLALWLAEIYRSRRDMTNALVVLDRAIAVSPKSGEPWVAKGLTYRANDDATNAVTAFLQALKLEPTHNGAVRALAETYLVLNNTNQLVVLLDQSFRQTCIEAQYWTMLGDLYGHVVRQKPSLAAHLDRNRSRLCYAKALAISPQDPDILARVRDACMDANDYAGAADAYARLIEVRPNIPKLRERLAEVYLLTGQKDKAITLYKELIKRAPGRFEFYNALGELYEDLHQPETALNYYEQSLLLNPEQPDGYLIISQVQMQLKRTDAASHTLDAWKKKFPVDWRVAYFRALLSTDEKNYTNSITAFAEAEALARETPSAKLTAQFYFNYGAAAERLGDTEKATALFRKSIALNPEFANAYNYLGYMWADKDTNLTEALTFIQKAVELTPDNGAYLDSLGWVLYKLNRPADALSHLRQATEVLEKEALEDKLDKKDRQADAVVYDHLAEVLWKLGKNTEAIAAWKRALELDPGNQSINDKLQRHSAAAK